MDLIILLWKQARKKLTLWFGYVNRCPYYEFSTADQNFVKRSNGVNG